MLIKSTKKLSCLLALTILFAFNGCATNESVSDVNFNEIDYFPHTELPFIEQNENQEEQSVKTSVEQNSFGDFDLIWPTKGTLTSVYGMRKLRRKTRMHSGIDIGARKGTPILASGDGKVIFAGRKKGYGYSVVIRHDREHQTLYAHMSKINVKRGQIVTRNKIIGFVGRTGHVTGSNLHFETRINGVPQNPLLYLPPNHFGKVKIGMKTPSYSEQLDYYNKSNSVAFENNRS